MDKPIEKKKWPAKRLLALAAMVVFVVLGYFALASTGKSTRAVDAKRVSAAQVLTGDFEEYVPIIGGVQPKTSVYLDLEEGGIVEAIYIEAGNPVEQGDLILSFSNTTAEKQNIDSETRLLENLDRLRNSKISLTEKNLLLKEQLLDLDYQVRELEKRYARYKKLLNSPSAQISEQEFDTTKDNLEYQRAKRELLKERIRQESHLREQQDEQIDQSIALVQRSLAALDEIRASLAVKALISGYLSSMTAEIGQSFARGQRIGQIDQLDNFKVRADVDQYYISKVAIDQSGTFDFGGQTYELTVTKIYPEVTNEEFQMDLEFVGPPAEGIKRGQTLQIDLSLSRSTTTKMISKGGFYRHTNGRWVYRIANDGMSAERVEIVAGRQNPKYFEILDGLNVGEWVITSSYDAYGDADILNFTESINL